MSELGKIILALIKRLATFSDSKICGSRNNASVK